MRTQILLASLLVISAGHATADIGGEPGMFSAGQFIDAGEQTVNPVSGGQMAGPGLAISCKPDSQVFSWERRSAQGSAVSLCRLASGATVEIRARDGELYVTLVQPAAEDAPVN